MARSVTVQSVIDGAFALCRDFPVSGAGALATAAQMLLYVDKAWAPLYKYYVQAEPDRFRTEATITVTVAATPSYSLPSLWFATIGIDYAVGTTRRKLRRLAEHERNVYAASSAAESQAYRLGETTLTLFPTPLVGQTYTHIYLPTAPVIAAAGTSLDCRIGHEDYLEKKVAKRLLQIEEAYDGRWDAELAQLEAELKLDANMRYFDDMVVMHRDSRRRRRWPWADV